MGNALSAAAQVEVQQGRALPLEDGLQQIVDAVDEVLLYVVTEPAEKSARVEFVCRVHEDIVMPLAFLSPIPGIIPIEVINGTVSALKRHTDTTLNFK